MIKQKFKKYRADKDYDLFGMQFSENVESQCVYGVTNSVYMTSNEYLSDYFECYDFIGKKIATVGSSGDQLLNAIFYGCRDLTLIDGCILAQPYIEYKFALIKNLNFDEFIKIYFNHDSIFDWSVYARISHDLSDVVKQFFDEIFLLQEPHSRFSDVDYFKTLNEYKIKSSIVNRISGRKYGSLFYQDEESYNKLKRILNTEKFNIDYKIAKFQDFPTELNEKYDAIFLSNIYDYVPRLSFIRTINKLRKSNLNEGGIIQYQYQFLNTPDNSKRPSQFELRNLKEIYVPQNKSSTSLEHGANVYFLEK